MPSHAEPGKLYIVGTGPGSPGLMTNDAVRALGNAEYVIGNSFYLTPIAGLIEGKQVIRSTMEKKSTGHRRLWISPETTSWQW